MRTSQIAAFAIAAFISFTSQAQNPVSPGDWDNIRVDRLSIDQGLSQVTVLAILQDRRGFIWMGTQNGLNRYDGYGMTVFTHQADDSLSICGNFIYALHEDRKGYIWIGTRDNGLSCYDPLTETFRRYPHIPGRQNSLSDNFVHAIHEDSHGTIWIGTWNGGLNALNPKTGVITHYLPNPNSPNSLSHKTVTSISEDKSGALWIGTFGGGICRLDPSRKKFDRFVHNPENANSLSHNRVISIYKDPSEKEDLFWIGTVDGGLNRLEVSSLRLTSYQKQDGNAFAIPSNRAHGICVDPSNPRYLWVGTWDSGLCLFDKQSKRFKSFGYDSANPQAVSAQMLFSIVADRTGNIWIGTQGGGVNKIDPQKQVFELWSTTGKGHRRLKANDITAILEERSGQGVWVSTVNGGLHYLSPKNNTSQSFSQIPGIPFRLSDYHIRTILEDRKGNLWVGASGLGLFVRKAGDSRFQHVKLEEPGPAGELRRVDVKILYEDRSGQLWVGSLSKGLFHINPDTYAVRNYQHNTEDTGSLSSNDILAIGEDAAGRLWLGTRSGGLNLLDKNTGRIICYKNDPERLKSLVSNSVNDIQYPKNNPELLVLATAGGICLLNLSQSQIDDPAKTNFILVGQNEGLTDNTVYDILEDRQGRFWASTTKGLYVLALQKNGNSYQMKVVRQYDKSDGLQSNEFNLGASFINAKGEMYFGGVDGLNLIHPDKESASLPHSPVVFTLFEKYTKSGDFTGAVSVPGISLLEQITLAYAENIFSVEFAALNYKNATKNSYAYQLEGESDNWIELGQRRRLTFANLAPGHYTLRIRSSYQGGPWSDQVASLRIVIRPPWWRSAVAWAVYSMLLAGAILLIRRYERNRMRTKSELKIQASRAEQLKELDRLKSEFFANISHEFRTPLTLISGPLEQLMSGAYHGNTQQEYTLMKSNAQRLQKLIDQLLDLSKLDAGKLDIHKRNEDIVEFARQILTAFQPLAEKGRIHLDFQSNVPSCALDFDPEQMEKILFNLLSNAFKFTPAHGRIWLQIEKITSGEQQPFIQINVGDTGKGISRGSLPFVFDRFYKSEETSFEAGTGIGLALAKELVSLHGGKIVVESEQGKGAVFQLRFPLLQSAPKSAQPHIVSPAPVTDEWLGARHLEAAPAMPVVDDALPLVLVVEDNVEMSGYIQRSLADSYQIVTAFDGRQGLKLAQEMVPDLIISDLMMPEMNGYELCKKIKADEYCSHIPLILLTAKASGGSRIEGLQAGADDYLIKPFNVRELKARVNNLIAQRKQLRTLLGNALKQNTGGPVMSKADAAVMEKLQAIIDEHLGDENFDVDQLARKAGFSRAQLYRKVKALTDQSVSEYIQMVRLKRAAELILQQTGNVNEVAYAVGFKDPSYFSKCFRKQFNCLPSEYLARQG
ncbi:MAG: response regulator [Saprospiraceae bacterium]|nr:response regulator [Saprospiraceae bacterium]